MATVIVVAMPKGGVGKTATAAALGWGLSELKKPTLMIDLDSQAANLTVAMGVDGLAAKYTSKEFLFDHKQPVEPQRVTEFLSIIPADLTPLITEIQLQRDSVMTGPVKLKSAIERIADRYEYIVCDCRPGGGAMMANALRACDEVVAPVQLTRFALLSIQELRTFVCEVFQGGKAPRVRYLPTFYEQSTKEARESLAVVLEVCQGELFGVRIPRATAISKALSEAKSIFDPAYQDSQGPACYQQLIQEIVEG